MTNLNSLQRCDGFNFSSTHNDIQCIESMKPEDTGTEHQFWFTRQMLREIFGVKSEDTITNHVEALINRGVVTVAKNLATVRITNTVGAVNKTTIYDLKVFNFLAMRLDTDRAWEVKEKFNDVLVTEETHAKTTLPALSKEDNFLLNIIHAEDKENIVLALKDYKTYRDERERELEQERDELKRTKAFISTKRESTAMGKLGGTTKALVNEREKNTKLLKENIELIKEKEKLKIRLCESDEYKTIRQMTNKLKTYILTDTKSLQRLGKEMTKISMEMGFKVIQVPDDRYPKVNSYHSEVWRETFAKLNNDPLFLIDIRK